jgi:L-amino acid N-acyltransferase YncA
MGKRQVRIEGRNVVVRRRLCRVAEVDGEGYKFLEDPEAAIAALRDSGIRADLFTFMQELSESSPLYKYPYERDNFAVLPISTIDQWWTKQIGFKARNKAKQAEKKGIVIREVPFVDALVHGIWEIYNEVLVRQGRRFPHYGKSLESVRAMSATFLDSSVFIGAFDGEKLVGFIKMTMNDARTQAGLMHILSLISYRDKAPTNALLAQAVRSCANRGVTRLVYANFAYGKKSRSSLSDFKERNGFERVDVPRYYVPLTKWGALIFRLGLHRRLAEQMPESIAAKLRDLRGRWYQRRFNLSTESF